MLAVHSSPFLIPKISAVDHHEWHVLESLFLKIRDALGDPESFQDFWRGLVCCECLMACCAVLGNRLISPCCVHAIVAPETSRKVCMAQVIRVCAPRNLQVRKDVAIVNRKYCFGRLLDILRTASINVGVSSLVEANQGSGQFVRRVLACTVFCLQ